MRVSDLQPSGGKVAMWWILAKLDGRQALRPSFLGSPYPLDHLRESPRLGLAAGWDMLDDIEFPLLCPPCRHMELLSVGNMYPFNMLWHRPWT
jgi:hypothetical protein